MKEVKLYIKVVLGFCCLIILVVGCIDEIEFSGDRDDLGINISGQFTNLLERQVVVIRKALDVNAESTIIGDPIEDAQVVIMSDDGSSINLPYEGKGEYALITKGQEGIGYRLIVTTSDGQVYESEMEILLESLPILSLQGAVKEEQILGLDGLVSIFPKMAYIITTNLSNRNDFQYAYYRAKGEYEFMERQTAFGNSLEDSKVCYISEVNDLGNVFTLDGSDLPNGEALNREVFSIDYNWKFEVNYGLKIEQYIINQKAYEYWNKVEQLTKEASLFDPPPGRFFGNIKAVDLNNDTEVRGYFTVAGKSEIRTFVNSGDLQRPVDNYCLSFIRIGQMSNQALPDFCVDCLKARNSTIERPEYWPL